jgi:hypothetical protein
MAAWWDHRRVVPNDAPLYAATSTAPPPSPFEWKPERLRGLLRDEFDLRFEEGVTTLRMPNGKAVWDLFVEGVH